MLHWNNKARSVNVDKIDKEVAKEFPGPLFLNPDIPAEDHVYMIDLKQVIEPEVSEEIYVELTGNEKFSLSAKDNEVELKAGRGKTPVVIKNAKSNGLAIKVDGADQYNNKIKLEKEKTAEIKLNEQNTIKLCMKKTNSNNLNQPK